MLGGTGLAETGYNKKRVSNIAIMPKHVVTAKSGYGR
jgi:hypothetical protein